MQLPMRLGEYTLVEPLARGESTDVFVARWDGPPTDDPVRVAIKVSRDDATADTRQLLLREATLARRLVHPNIVRTLAFGEQDGRAYQVMELGDGPSLASLLAEGTALGLAPTPVQALEVALQVAAALRYAHGLDDHILHLRVNPRNILLTREHRVLLTDFAVPRTADATLPGKALGPPEDVGYLAPEQITGLPVDERADQFAVAAVLWELLCGRALFRNEREAEQATALQPSRVKSGAPPLIDDVVLRALERDPTLRFESVEDFSAALDEASSVLAPEQGERSLGLWIDRVLAGDRGPLDSTRPEPLDGPTLEATPDVTERNIIAAVSDEDLEGTDLTLPVPAAPRGDAESPDADLDPSESSMPALLSVQARRHPVVVDNDDAQTVPIKLPLTESTAEAKTEANEYATRTAAAPVAAAPGGPSLALVGGGALALGLAIGALAVWALRDKPADLRQPPSTAAAAANAVGDGDTATTPEEATPPPSSETPSAEAPSGRCGKTPVGGASERASGLVAEARGALLDRDFIEATRLLTASLQIAATSAAHYELGRLAIRADDIEGARRSLGCALVLAPESEDAQRAAVELARLSVGGEYEAGKGQAGAKVDRRARGRRPAALPRDAALDRLSKCDSPCARLLVDAVGRRTGENLDQNLVFAVEECLGQCKVMASGRVAQELLRTATRAVFRGDLKAATRAAQRGLALAPNNAALHRVLGTVYKKQERKGLARKHLTRYLELKPQAKDAATIRSYLKELR